MANFSGTSGNDTFEATAGPDVFDGRDGRDTVGYLNSPIGLNIFMIPSGDATGYAIGDVFRSIEIVRGTRYGDFIHGNDDDNELHGLEGNDTLYGHAGSNRLYGGPGVDNLVGSVGIDFMDGGAGIDTLSYQLAAAGLVVSLADPRINTGWAAGDTYVNIEDVTGTNHDDTIHGDGQAVNNLWGLDGNDRIFGGPGYDVMIGGAGADHLDGGEGTDLADYEDSDSPVIASLANPAINTGFAKGDVYVDIEDIAGGRFDDILYGDDRNNGMDGWPGNDVLHGGAGNDGLFGNDGDDILHGEGDWDLIDGGNGRDAAGFHGPIGNYKVWLSDGWINGQYFGDTKGAWMVSAKTGDEGIDTCRNIEYLRFADMTVNLTIKDAVASGIEQSQVKLLQELYIAFFNRIPEVDGLEYWINRHKVGLGIESIAEYFYAAGVEAGELTGYSSSMTNQDFVNLVYRNVLGRADGADAEGLAYWSNTLATGQESRGSLVSAILGSAHTFKGHQQWGWVADLLDNKASVADTFAVQLGLGYRTAEDSITEGMQIAAAITPFDTSTAIGLIGVSTIDIAI